MSGERTRSSPSRRNVCSVENFPCVVDDRYYLRRMKEILLDGVTPKPSPPVRHDQVSPHIYLGNQRNADDTTSLRQDGIDHVLSCAASRRSTESPYDAETSGIVDYFLIPAEDREDFDIARFFDAAILFLDRVKRRKGKALVHCNMGVNRSGAVVAAYLMVDERRNLLDVIAYLKDKRRLVLSNKGFRRQLVQFARDRGLLDPVVDTVTRISYMDDKRRMCDEPEQPEVSAAGFCDAKLTGRPEAEVSTNSLQKLIEDMEDELKNGSSEIVKEKTTMRKTRTVRDRVSEESMKSNEQRNSVKNADMISTGDENVSSKNGAGRPEPKFSSSVQYWPVVDLPRRAKSPSPCNNIKTVNVPINNAKSISSPTCNNKVSNTKVIGVPLKSTTTDDPSLKNSKINNVKLTRLYSSDEESGTILPKFVPKPTDSENRRKPVRQRDETCNNHDNQATVNAGLPPVKGPSAAAAASPDVGGALSSLYCTLRKKPIRNIIRVGKSSEDVGQAVSQPDTTNRESQSAVIQQSITPVLHRRSAFFAEETSTITFRSRCMSGTAVDRPSSVGGGGGGADTLPSSGSLVLLGKKIVQTRSASQWNVAANDGGFESIHSFLSSESRQSRVLTTRSRTDLSEVSRGDGLSNECNGSWSSIKRISSSTKNVNYYFLRND